MLFLTQLTSTYFKMEDEPSSEGWKNLQTKYLRELLSLDPLLYRKVIEALLAPLAKGQILECDGFRIVGQKAFGYRIGKNYIKKGFVSYELRCKKAQTLLKKNTTRIATTYEKNPIVSNVKSLYASITLPTVEEIKLRAQELILEGFKNKKGKKLKFLNKHPKDYYKHADSLSFVEDAIEIFLYLTENGVMQPMVGSEASGGRVVDSLTLMPSWIRSMVKINGEPIVECDYRCLHPNIAMALYRGSKEYLSHSTVQMELNIDLVTVKQEHLSFFNKKVWQMKQSPLYKYYSTSEPNMLTRLMQERNVSEHGYKETSRRLFAKEVEIMKDVIKELNDEGIYVGYIYDAVFCTAAHADRVKQVMDVVILKHGVKTTANITSSSIPSFDLDSKQVQQSTKSIEYLRTDDLASTDEINKVGSSLQQKPAPLSLQMSDLNFSTRMKKSIIHESTVSGVMPVFVDALVYFDDGTCCLEQVLEIDDILNSASKYITYRYLNENWD